MISFIDYPEMAIDAGSNEFFIARREHAFWLRHFEFMTYSKIGERLGITLERARQMVRRATRDRSRANG